MYNFIITMIVGILVGYVFLRLKVPGAMMIGSILGVSIFNILSNMAFVPAEGRIVAQIIAGAFIGVGLDKSDLYRLKNIFKPLMTILIGLFTLNIVVGFIIYFISPLDLLTSFMCAIPGGMSDIPLISVEMGADSTKVAAMQFIRLIFGIGVFPSMISKVSKLDFLDDEEIEKDKYERNVEKTYDKRNLAATLIIATISGLIGKVSGIPSGTLVFSMIGVIGFNLLTAKACLPMHFKRLAQVLSGTYIGSSVVFGDLLEIKFLLLPAIVLILGYAITSLVLGAFIHKKFNMPTKDAMLACTPAGATDMALIASDIGVKSADVIVIQVIRMVVVISIFPQVIRIIVSLFA